MIIYLLKWAFALTLFYSLYGLTLRRETFHTLNRAVLLVILVVSAVLPLCPIPLGHETWLSQGFQRLEEVLTTNQVVSDEQAKRQTDIDNKAGETIHADENIQLHTSFHHDGTIIPSSQNNHSIMMERSTRPVSSRWSTIVLRLFVLTTAAFWLVYLRSLIGVVRLIRRSSLIEERDGARILSCPELKNSCSWMRWVLVAEAGEESSGKEFSSILTHELAHVRLGHSWDKLLCELTCRTLWWLPFAWMLREDMTDVHEFEADRAVLRTGIDIRAYNQLLILKAVRPGLQPVVNAFNQSRIKKRITMMFKPKSNKWRAAKVLYLLPVMAFALVAFAKPISSPTPLSLPVSEGSSHQLSASTSTLDFTKPSESNVSIKEFYGVLRIDGEPVTLPLSGDWLNDINLSKVTVTKDEQGNIIQMDLRSKAANDSIYDVVEVMAGFPGGNAACFEWLRQNIHYPEEAVTKKIQGRVLVQFVVERDGSIVQAKVLKSPDELLSNEALRVVNQMPAWDPAKVGNKTVRSHFILPIIFKFPQK